MHRTRKGSALAALACGAVRAAPVLAQAAIDAGVTLSQLASGFPRSGNAGPLGIAFTGSGSVMVSDYPGNVRVFATDADDQVAYSAPVTANLGRSNAVGLARSGNFIYATQQGAGSGLIRA